MYQTTGVQRKDEGYALLGAQIADKMVYRLAQGHVALLQEARIADGTYTLRDLNAYMLRDSRPMRQLGAERQDDLVELLADIEAEMLTHGVEKVMLMNIAPQSKA
jgi:acyl transferase domain-containing protein